MRKIGLVIIVLTAMFMCVSSVQAVTQAEKDTAIARGLAWLANQQVMPDGYIEEPQQYLGTYRVSLTAFAVLKWAEHANNKKPPIDPFDPGYTYSSNIEAGLNYIFTKGYDIELNMEHGSDNPDGDGDWRGIYFLSDSHDKRSLYETGIFMMALQACGHPDNRSGTGPGPYLDQSYRKIMQDMVDFVSWAQQDVGWGRGGWRYCAWDDGVAVPVTGITDYAGADNSVSQWPVLGLMSAEAWGIYAPTFVKTELKTYWLANSQDPSSGCFWYDRLGSGDTWRWTGCGPFAVTASGLVQLTYCGVDTTDAKWVNGRQCICDNWSNQNIGNLYAMYGLMKAAMTTKSPIWWFCTHEWQPEYDAAILAVQDTMNSADPNYGSWPANWAVPCEGQYWGWSQVLSTEWALLILQKVAPPTGIPTLTEWGLIIFGVVLLGFITWVFLRRRKAAISYQ